MSLAPSPSLSPSLLCLSLSLSLYLALCLSLSLSLSLSVSLCLSLSLSLSLSLCLSLSLSLSLYPFAPLSLSLSPILPALLSALLSARISLSFSFWMEWHGLIGLLTAWWQVSQFGTSVHEAAIPSALSAILSALKTRFRCAIVDPENGVICRSRKRGSFGKGSFQNCSYCKDSRDSKDLEIIREILEMSQQRIIRHSSRETLEIPPAKRPLS